MKVKQNIYAMYAISLLQGMVFYTSIATLYRRAAGINMFEMAVIESVSLAVSIALELPWGVIADRIGYKNTMLVCNFLFFISKIIFWKATGFLGFLIERILLGIVISGLSGVDTSILYLSCEKDESTKVFGMSNNLGTIGVMLSSLIYSIYVGQNYRLSALLTVVTYGLAFVVSFFLIEVKPENKEQQTTFKNTLEILKDVLKNKKLLLLVFSLGLTHEVYQNIYIFLNQLQYQRCHIPEQYFGYIHIAATILGLLGGYAYLIEKKIGEQKTILYSYILLALSCTTLIFTTSPILSIVAIIAINIFTITSGTVGKTIQNRLITCDDRATALSVLSLIMDAIAIISGLLFGKMADFRLTFAFSFGFISCILGIVLFIVYLQFDKKQ